MDRLKISLVCTIFNEEKTITHFLESVDKQSLFPDEIIIVDGGSTDDTIKKISEFIFSNTKKTPTIKLIFKEGNRSIGRNAGIKSASGKIIVSSDAGCILDKDWIREIIKPFGDKKVDVVAGYYAGVSKNIFQKSLIPYVLVMEDKINEKEFLPATRSMAFKKIIWEKVGGFDEKLSHNEDYSFANNLKAAEAKMVFAKEAIVKWIPRNNLKQAFVMFFRFALGDIQAKLYREKVVYIFLRYIFGLYLLFLAAIMHALFLNIFISLLISSYIGWSIKKNYKYVNDWQAFFYLPVLQFISDIAVMSGTLVGLVQSFSVRQFLKGVSNNKIILFFLAVYACLMFAVIQWGIPNISHPFTYHMDEWHFSQAIRTFLKFGTGSVSGAASIPLYHIVSSLIFLIPFYILRIVDPLAIKSSVENLSMQNTFFEILRLHTLFYGVLTVTSIYLILKKHIRLFTFFFVSIFIFNPIWLSLSNYYKYDITLNFWIMLTILFVFRFSKSKKFIDYIFAGIACALALSTKFTAAPLFAGYLLSFFLFSDKKEIKKLLLSVFIVGLIFLTVGIPDMLLGKGNYSELLYSTLVKSPQIDAGYNLGMAAWIFLVLKEYPSLLGYFLTFISYLGLLYWTVLFLLKILQKKLLVYKLEFFLYVTAIIFFISTIAFGIDGGGNRVLVLLPFFVLLSAAFVKDVLERFGKFPRLKWLITIAIIIGLSVQILQSYAWLSVKLAPDPRSVSSQWIVKNIPVNSTIGLENIPIYQMLPDILLKEFYLKQHDNKLQTRYNYSVISATDNTLPKYVIVTSDYNNVGYLKNSPKKDLVKKLTKEKYKRIATFSPNLKYYNYFADRIYLIITNVMPLPITISIYEKN
jgi:glycosyltransferase involved in cell wall biosynthesis